jgi:hypothetical protein
MGLTLSTQRRQAKHGRDVVLLYFLRGHRDESWQAVITMARRMIVYVDGTERRVVESPFTRGNGRIPDMFTGEKITLDVVPLKNIEQGTFPAFETDDSYDNDTFKVGVGVVDSPPDSGTFKITYKTDTTSTISYSSTLTAQQIQDALNDASMTDLLADSASGVTVTGTPTLGFRIRWASTGAKDDFGSDEVNLLPESLVVFANERDGDTGITEVVSLSFMKKQAGLTTSATEIPAGSMSATEIVAGSRKTREIFDITCIADTAAVAQREEAKAVEVGGTYDVHTITTIADTADSMDGDYFVLPGKNGAVGFWFDTNADAAVAPAACIAASSRQVEVTTIVAGDSAATVATKLAVVLEADADFVVTDVTTNLITVKAASIDTDGTASAGTSGFTITQTVVGAETDAYNGKYFYLNALRADGGTDVVAFYFSQDELTDPPAAAIALDSSLTEIAYDLDATAQEMAATIAAAITARARHTAVASGTEIHVTHTLAGDVADMDAGDSPLTSLSVTQNGADSTLDGKHFIAYETNTLGGERSRAFWFNVSGTSSPSGTALTADRTTEIVNVTSGMKAHQVAAAVATVMDSLDTFSATAKGTKIRFETSEGFAFTDASAETSGFTFTKIQEGGTGSDASELVEISVTDQAIGGVFSLSVDTGGGAQTTAGIPWNATPEDIVASLEALPNIATNAVSVEGGRGGNIRISFRNSLADTAINVSVDYSGMKWIAGKRFTLDLNTTSARSLLYGKESLTCILEVEASQVSGYTVKLVHAPVILRNGLIDPTALSPSPTVDHYTESEVDNLVIHHMKNISSLTGGTSADLDSVVTTGITPERGVFFYDADNSAYTMYVLRAGTEAESVPDYIRPDDYDGSTNAKFWQRIDLTGVTDHGALTGLADDDHTQYLKADGTRAGGTISFQSLQGINFTPSAAVVISGDAITSNRTFIELTSQSGTTDDLDTINLGSEHAGEGDIIILYATAGHTITLIHDEVGSYKIRTHDGANVTVTSTKWAILAYVSGYWMVLPGGESGGGGGGSIPVVDTTAISYDPIDNTKQVRLDAGAVAAGQTRAIQAPDGNCRVRDCIKWMVFEGNSYLSTSTFWLGQIPANFVMERVSGITYDGSGNLNVPSFVFSIDGTSIVTVNLNASNNTGSGHNGSSPITSIVGAGNVLSITVTETGAGSAGIAAVGLFVYIHGYWQLD